MSFKVLIGNKNPYKNKILYTPYDNLLIEFCNVFSKKLIKSKNLSPEIYAFGFWLRRGNIELILSELPSSIKAPIGNVFHVAPRNVDTMFLYSLFISFLNGNNNVIRISKDTSENSLIQIIIKILKSLLSDQNFTDLKKIIHIVSYDRDDKVNEYFSLNSDARIIWGGDNTINYFKSIPTKARVKDFYFADRISIGIYDVDSILKLNEKQNLIFVKNFLNDVISFDQLGCSSPSTIYFLGDNELNLSKVIKKILNTIEELDIYKDYDYASFAGFKLNQIVDDTISGVISDHSFKTTLIHFVRLKTNDGLVSLKKTCGAGYLYYDLTTMNDISHLFKDKKIQTVSYFGISPKVKTTIVNLTLTNPGVDRIVPCGKSLDFSHKWDGYNLLENLSREIVLI
tara:strand:+ start:8082 stop:9275 length:1194 start_codon:yes stop_codon:yes gene_type:complete